MDNWSGHCSFETGNLFLDILEIFNIKLVFLPKYSPELNPVEKVFNITKHYVKSWSTFLPILQGIANAISRIRFKTLKKMYVNCIKIK